MFKRKKGAILNPIMAELTFVSMPVKYESAILPVIQVIKSTRYQYLTEEILVERPARMKVWQVAVKTVFPDVAFTNYSAWMLHILTVHDETIRAINRLEATEIARDAAMYYFTLQSKNDLAPVKQEELPNN